MNRAWIGLLAIGCFGGGDDVAEETGNGETGLAVEIPVGWTGPVQIFAAAGDEPPVTCADGTAGMVTFDQVTADDAVCGCDCEAPDDVTCPTTGTFRVWDNSSNCLVIPDETVEVTEGCNDLGLYDDVRVSFSSAAPDLDGVTCTAMPTTDLPEPIVDTQYTVCASRVASAPECIWQEGDVGCPAGEFAVRTVVYETVADDRDCSACSCGDATGDCEATFDLRAGVGCGAGSPAELADGDCTTIDTPARSGRLTIEGAAVTCEPADVGPTGGVTAEDPLTVCCTG